MKRNHAFTLLELLVALAVVAVLAALTMGTVNKVISTSDTTKCLSNLKTIGGAMQGYTADNNGYFPPHSSYAFSVTSGAERVRQSGWHWMAYLAPYLGAPDASGPMPSVFDCPADPKVKTWPKPRPWIPASSGDTSHKLSSYGYNYYHLTTSSSWWPRGSDEDRWPTVAHVMANPAKLILVADGREVSGDPIVSPFSVASHPALRHGGRFNAVFLDGHVESLEKAAAGNTKYWRPQ